MLTLELTDEEYIYTFGLEHVYLHLSVCLSIHPSNPSIITITLFSMLSIVPDSPPTNLTVVDTSPSTATLSWSPPEQANGVIQYYQVHYGNDTFEMSINTTTHSATLMDLKPFSFYNVSVRAFTRLGHGNQRSDSLHLLSGEDGMFIADGAYDCTVTRGRSVTHTLPMLKDTMCLLLHIHQSAHFFQTSDPLLMKIT
uniref:Fibronectin type-III domain-containing protein n=1 Tax=Periophthalmus magnuspinnatus TaxID=409849 RepID=A0A3B4BK73_9GOBI